MVAVGSASSNQPEFWELQIVVFGVPLTSNNRNHRVSPYEEFHGGSNAATISLIAPLVPEIWSKICQVTLKMAHAHFSKHEATAAWTPTNNDNNKPIVSEQAEDAR